MIIFQVETNRCYCLTYVTDSCHRMFSLSKVFTSDKKEVVAVDGRGLNVHMFLLKYHNPSDERQLMVGDNVHMFLL